MMHSLCLKVTLFIELCMITSGTLEVYEGPDPVSNTSPFFTVQLIQENIIKYPHVYYSKVNNEYVADQRFYNQTISWIEFGQNHNDQIDVVVCLKMELKGTFIYSTSNPPFLLPYQYNIDPQKKVKLLNESCLSLNLDSSIGNKKHLSLEYRSTETNSFHDAFYIFIGDLDPVYNSSDPHTLHFGPGLHDIVSGKKNNILQTGDDIHTIFISRGAWVYGKIEITGSNTKINTKIIGHGILDGTFFNYAQRKNNKIDGAPMIGFQNWGKSVTLNGLTSHNPSDSSISLLSKNSNADQYRCIAWYYNNDGIGLSSNSSLSNSFIRTNDDSVKPWAGGPQHIENIVISQMYNGAAFQLGWNNVGCVNCKILNSSIIHAYWYQDWDQNAVIDLNYKWDSGQSQNAKWNDVLFENIYIDTPVGRMFSILLENHIEGASTTVNNLTINNFISRTELKWFGNPDDLTPFQMIKINDSNHGTNWVHNVHFNNVKVNNKQITNNKDWNMEYFGDTSDIQHISYA